MDIGSLVWNEYHGLLRFGTIASKTIKEDGWAYYTVAWHRDEMYEEQMKWRETMTHTNYYITEYRKDMLHLFSRDRLRDIVECVSGGKKCGYQKCKNKKCKQKRNLQLS